jgi:hypothetical protein
MERFFLLLKRWTGQCLHPRLGGHPVVRGGLWGAAPVSRKKQNKEGVHSHTRSCHPGSCSDHREGPPLTTQVATLTTPIPTLVPDPGKMAYVQGGDIWGKTLPKEEASHLI